MWRDGSEVLILLPRVHLVVPSSPDGVYSATFLLFFFFFGLYTFCLQNGVLRVAQTEVSLITVNVSIRLKPVIPAACAGSDPL